MHAANVLAGPSATKVWGGGSGVIEAAVAVCCAQHWDTKERTRNV